ncbi:GNAT family N-acetyltransferase [Ornithinibacillus sp. JPR2-1]|uniref:GNAT family N-acetyltransferase n=1 Tax=Ornithinibacillus sp. JPR2-1 TaxID=2094019 RepID=UPI0031DEE786
MTTELKLRPLALADYDTVLRWSRDDIFCSFNGWALHRDPEELYQWWRHCVDGNTNKFVRLGVTWQDQLIGYADLAKIADNAAELGIAIGERRLWGKGLGYHACRKMIDYGSENFGITTFYAESHESNTRSRKMLERLGFKEISRIGTDSYLGVDTQLIQYQLK